MILIGQYDSSFVRRTAIAMALLGMDFEHRPWSVFGDADRLRELNPLVRVPTLVLDDGEVLVDSATILDHLETLVPPEKRLWPQSNPERRHAMKIAAIATGTADMAVGLFYTLVLHETPSPMFVERRAGQIAGALDWLEAERRRVTAPWWFGGTPGHADIAVGCMLRHVTESLPAHVNLGSRPALAAHAAACEAMPVFQEHSQPFIPPA
ncbi:MAG: glutathione S-transferase family protein [Notoacmeibacter sp.]|nr:glutathione S-transferase family protein [Notoacmeibacter sp.]MCC0032823.1 glutathione S-transferase family protein [Brucellaceae bacterium]